MTDEATAAEPEPLEIVQYDFQESVARWRELAELVGVEPLPEGKTGVFCVLTEDGRQLDLAEILLAYAGHVAGGRVEIDAARQALAETPR